MLCYAKAESFISPSKFLPLLLMLSCSISNVLIIKSFSTDFPFDLSFQEIPVIAFLLSSTDIGLNSTFV
jgi:hypothetical protein